MRRTLTTAAVAAALLVPAGPLPGAEAGAAAPAAAGRWSAREAQSFWTPERMAAAVPLPSATPAPSAPSDLPASAPSDLPSPAPSDLPAPAPSDLPSPAPSVLPASAPPPAPASASPSPVRLAAAPAPGIGQDFAGIPVVGRMFVVKGGSGYFCTASVVSSPGRDLVLSAAHCLLGTDARQVAFVPLYTRARPQPYGMFPVLRDKAGRSRVWIDPRYRSRGPNRAATLDVAFARVGPDARGRRVEDVVGGNRLVTGSGYAHARVSLIGYPSSAARPRLCVNRTTKFTSGDARIPGSFLRIDCTGYPGGTSGGPFLTRYDARTRTGDVVGIIGGWKLGGDRPDTSYSSYFGADVRTLYAKAAASAKAG
ncbi:trypsin-like peptidase domain-containing protein [Streptomyces sp. NPDC058662]|uniref:trypsin-like peptidase domain-containing protein n=1 Tax=Streptomyces sp. NPDC058662 TaxID=3346583 RepID=UPI003659A7B4